MNRKSFWLVLVMLVVALALGGCIKKWFCNLDLDKAETTLKTEAQYVDSIYWHYVTLLKGGDEKARPIVVAMDLFLAVAKPILGGLQQGVCYPTAQIAEALDKAQVVKAEQAAMGG